MPSPQLTHDQIARLSTLVADYIAAQRDKFVSHAAPLSTVQRSAMDGFFRSEVLAAKLLILLRHRVENPPFYPMLVGMGFTNLPDFSGMAAITFKDVVVSHEVFTDGLLFHELVHVEQYRQVGIQRFAQLYVTGFLNGGRYEGIPLEVHAYALGARFEHRPEQRFSVADEVATWLEENRF